MNTKSLNILPGKFIVLSKNSKKYKFTFKETGVIELNGKKETISIEEKDGFTYICSGNKKYNVEIAEKNQNKYQILINSVSYDLSVETPISFRRKRFLQKKNVDRKNIQIEAPMPGKIIEVLVEEGTEVNAGDSVLILEAMKMQNEITSEQAGKVKKINVKAEDNVMKSDVLIEFEK
jgi:biotin carboxyl carrier protein